MSGFSDIFSGVYKMDEATRFKEAPRCYGRRFFGHSTEKKKCLLCQYEFHCMQKNKDRKKKK